MSSLVLVVEKNYTPSTASDTGIGSDHMGRHGRATALRFPLRESLGRNSRRSGLRETQSTIQNISGRHVQNVAKTGQEPGDGDRDFSPILGYSHSDMCRRATGSSRPALKVKEIASDRVRFLVEGRKVFCAGHGFVVRPRKTLEAPWRLANQV